ncbi:hypothetical protein SAMN05444580_103448 [Rhodococcus tukisamuensis]|uniref:Type ISP restriction-modification enzyme LLaBIII C-terminal specificity domain-containing protein n=1 Tax=Rhodococcus tukisamuensis TaxID=168276 RepID=A0A1G6T9S2_9NOCA|nr:hypothetical protein SAMN05444580_103448 [Rhodococcus tukisamuensis]
MFEAAVKLGRTVLWLHTYGDVCIDEAAGRPERNVRLPVSDPARITNLTAVEAIPDTICYDPETLTIQFGGGSFGPVGPEVWEYTVGGRNVIRSWFIYRKTNPTGRWSSPLDDINAEEWPSDWNGEFIDLLTVLTRLVALHPQQAELLDQIVTGPVAAMDTLAATGVTWPTSNADKQRKPDYSIATTTDTARGQLGFDFGGS